MKRALLGLFTITIIVFSCKTTPKNENQIDPVSQSDQQSESSEFTIVFASCNDQDREQLLWQPIIDHNPDVFIWGGDNIYADTDDMAKMQADYNKQNQNPDYVALKLTTPVIGTWDDHDYGVNDGGVEWGLKKEAQELFWDFLDVDANDPLRAQEGVYHKKEYKTAAGSVQILLLDTRSFRTGLLENEDPDQRYKPWPKGHDGSVLGATQWEWLQTQLQDNTYDFTIIVTSIQFLSGDHGYEKWDHFPDEVAKMYSTLKNAKAPNIFMLSGDRHHAELQLNKDAGLGYPLVELTSSGLTHTYPGDPLEPNPYRVGEGTKELNFSVIKLDFENKKVTLEIRGKDNYLFEQMSQQY